MTISKVSDILLFILAVYVHQQLMSDEVSIPLLVCMVVFKNLEQM